jgi:hypothetical protein
VPTVRPEPRILDVPELKIDRQAEERHTASQGDGSTLHLVTSGNHDFHTSEIAEAGEQEVRRGTTMVTGRNWQIAPEKTFWPGRYRVLVMHSQRRARLLWEYSFPIHRRPLPRVPSDLREHSVELMSIVLIEVER